jgi:glycosyltransferase A (GT-A) superfamily protein (DUF2064 family)
MAYQEIPLTSDPNQEFSVTLEIDGVNRTLKFNLSWNYIGGYWVMRITDPATDEIIIDSVPLVAGSVGSDELNILHQHEYLGIGKAYIVPTKDPLEYDHPTDENLGTDFVLVWEG